ncbi:hypothetical protein M8C21_018173 [Ambrosia artemisiifolia]|uniref:Uncharacterized protein n=1 Tax=Ambrosia artemisiifolia TaxID=4212 RepID=A0AAD5CEU4_AMBAR|nr:hypothetical protein M8C21_018173 [Ambrosia artemisiifolia]
MVILILILSNSDVLNKTDTDLTVFEASGILSNFLEFRCTQGLRIPVFEASVFKTALLSDSRGFSAYKRDNLLPIEQLFLRLREAHFVIADGEGGFVKQAKVAVLPQRLELRFILVDRR